MSAVDVPIGIVGRWWPAWSAVLRPGHVVFSLDEHLRAAILWLWDGPVLFQVMGCELHDQEN